MGISCTVEGDSMDTVSRVARARRDILERAPAKFDDQGGGFTQRVNAGGVHDSLGFGEPKPARRGV
jgi:hypothetical protein